MNKEQLDNWSLKIFDAIKEISDSEKQKLSWTGQHSLYTSSFIETVNTLYDDLLFDEFLEYQMDEQNNEELYTKLKNLDIYISKYEEGNKSDSQILMDPKWHEINRLAKDIIDNWSIKE